MYNEFLDSLFGKYFVMDNGSTFRGSMSQDEVITELANLKSVKLYPDTNFSNLNLLKNRKKYSVFCKNKNPQLKKRV